MYREVRHIRLPQPRPDGLRELHAGSQALERILRLHPPPPALHRVGGRVLDVRHVAVNKVDAAVEWELVHASCGKHVGEMDLMQRRSKGRERMEDAWVSGRKVTGSGRVHEPNASTPAFYVVAGRVFDAVHVAVKNVNATVNMGAPMMSIQGFSIRVADPG